MKKTKMMNCTKIAILIAFSIGSRLILADEYGFEKPLHKAIYEGNIQEVEKLVKNRKTDVFEKENGWTPMDVALLEKGQPEAVRLLLENGYKINQFQIGEKTLLQAAVEGSNAEIVRIMIKKGAKIKVYDKYKNNILMRAMVPYSPNPEIVKILLENGADANEKNNYGDCALDHLKNQDKNKEVKRLLEAAMKKK